MTTPAVGLAGYATSVVQWIGLNCTVLSLYCFHFSFMILFALSSFPTFVLFVHDILSLSLSLSFCFPYCVDLTTPDSVLLR